MSFTLHVRNLKALRSFRWSPGPLSALIGANGAGKSTALSVFKLLRAAYDRSLPEAAPLIGGSHNLRSWGIAEDDPVEVGVDIGALQWRVRLIPRGPTVDWQADEWLMDGERSVFKRDSLGTVTYCEKPYPNFPSVQNATCLRFFADNYKDDAPVQQVAALVRSFTYFHDPDLYALGRQGSRTTEDRHLHSRGGNALTMLRRWSQERPLRERYQFVLHGLNAAFPGLVADLDFQEAGQTLVARLYRPDQELPCPIGDEANGVLQMLVLLCDLAASEPGGVVAIDEPENGLHPYAIRLFLRRAAARARQNNLTILLATHSTVLLDELNTDQVFVLQQGEDGVSPARLDQFRDPRWLASFKLGELYSQGELGSNGDAG